MNAQDTTASPARWNVLEVEGDVITSPMPANETIVEILTHDGHQHLALYQFQDAEEWAFVLVDEQDVPIDDSTCSIIAWRDARTARATRRICEAVDQVHAVFGGLDGNVEYDPMGRMTALSRLYKARAEVLS